MQTLLLVEDDTERLKDLESLACHEGRNILTAKNLSQAMKILSKQDIDLVVTDLALHSTGEDLDGLDLLRAAQAKDENLPVILISNYLTEEVTEAAIADGVFDIVDRATGVYEPTKMLGRKIGLALKFRRAFCQPVVRPAHDEPHQ